MLDPETPASRQAGVQDDVLFRHAEFISASIAEIINPQVLVLMI